MNKPLKLIKIGNSTGVILPKGVLARLHVALGDAVFLTEAPNGAYSLSASDAEFAEAMAAAEGIMREDRDILSVLAR
jgi:putative addiction module antidote